MVAELTKNLKIKKMGGLSENITNIKALCQSEKLFSEFCEKCEKGLSGVFSAAKTEIMPYFAWMDSFKPNFGLILHDFVTKKTIKKEICKYQCDYTIFYKYVLMVQHMKNNETYLYLLENHTCAEVSKPIFYTHFSELCGLNMYVYAIGEKSNKYSILNNKWENIASPANWVSRSNTGIFDKRFIYYLYTHRDSYELILEIFDIFDESHGWKLQKIENKEGLLNRYNGKLIQIGTENFVILGGKTVITKTLAHWIGEAEYIDSESKDIQTMDILSKDMKIIKSINVDPEISKAFSDFVSSCFYQGILYVGVTNDKHTIKTFNYSF